MLVAIEETKHSRSTHILQFSVCSTMSATHSANAAFVFLSTVLWRCASFCLWKSVFVCVWSVLTILYEKNIHSFILYFDEFFHVNIEHEVCKNVTYINKNNRSKLNVQLKWSQNVNWSTPKIRFGCTYALKSANFFIYFYSFVYTLPSWPVHLFRIIINIQIQIIKQWIQHDDYCCETKCFSHLAIWQLLLKVKSTTYTTPMKNKNFQSIPNSIVRNSFGYLKSDFEIFWNWADSNSSF